MIPSEPRKDEHDVNALASGVVARNTGIMMCSLGQQHELSLAKGQTFLRSHDPDRPLRNILPPDEVLEMLTYQAEEYRRHLLKEQQPLPQAPPRMVRDYVNYEINTVWSATSFDSGSSVLAPSEVAMTTVSAATAHVSNLDRYAPTVNTEKKTKTKPPKTNPIREFSVMEHLDEDTPSVASTVSATTASSPSSSCQSTPPGIMDIGNVRRRFKSHIESTGRVEKGSHVGQPSQANNANKSDPNTSSGSPLACQLLLGPCLGKVHGVPRKSRASNGFSSMSDCSDVLHLTMKAHLVDFYQYHYLTMFPNTPTPPGISSMTPSPVWKKHKHYSKSSSRRSEKVISPVSSSSSSISTSAGVDFFVGPTVFPVRFFLNDSIFMDLAVTGSLGLVERETRPRRSGRHGNPGYTGTPECPDVELPHRKSPDHYIVLLHRRSGSPLAVCALKAATSGPPTVRIYATKQRVISQRSVASTEQLGLNWSDTTYPLYAWAEMVATHQNNMKSFRYDLFMAAGSEGRFEPEPSYCASPSEPSSLTIHVVGRTESEESYTGCAIFSLESKKSNANQLVDSDDDDADSDDHANDEPFFRLSIARGIDPALMICLAAIIDEIMEKSMRIQCEAHTRVAFQRVHI
jgi:hypothetical protein